ncbi:uncharacterized protein N7496_005335 [Penicillium cataractarum]|uniref:Uncharacterized protein n=1 Tax=Penicillium cataractarum TaxID=2100454 RepID=A0A9W9SG13_9EURO|nr:uncharacterized protein N7496_005335 [Penicillium cataractarum]KAJ5377926.1 hypothetical protein N7496_005335 [Penicillium cataractarum]
MVSRIFERFGYDNVRQIEHMMIHIPATGGFLVGGHREPDVEIVKLVRDHCANVKNITISPYIWRALQPDRDADDPEQDIEENVAKVNTLLRSIPSLRGIFVRIVPRSHARRPTWNEYLGFMEKEVERVGWEFEEKDMGD